MLLPDSCALCGRLGRWPCPICVPKLQRCPPQLVPPEGVGELFGLFEYRDDVRCLLASMKFHNRRGPYRWVGQQMSALVTDTDFDCVTWVPSSRAGRAARGFQPARLLAEQVARRVRVPPIALLARGSDLPQVGRDRAQRLHGPALRARGPAPVGRVLLVDDVCTTGASLSGAALLLRQRGTRVVTALVAARAP